MNSINPAYQSPAMLARLRAAWKQPQELQQLALGQLLTPQALTLLTKELKTGWKRVSVPDEYSYETHTSLALQRELKEFITQITGTPPLREENKKFSHRDYTLLHDEQPQQPGIIGMLSLAALPEHAGGEIVFMKNGVFLGSFTPQPNTLLIARRVKGAQYFVHYLNHKLGKHALIIISA